MTSLIDRTTIEHRAPAPAAARLEDAVETAWGTIAPLWTLKNFVAVNPYQGFVEEPFARAIRRVERIFHARAVMPPSYHRERYLAGAIDEEDLDAAQNEAAPAPAPADRCFTYAELLDRRLGTDYGRLVVEETAKWCAARFDLGQAAWRQPFADAPVWTAFRQIARHDRGPEVRGLDGFRDYVAQLPADPEAAVRQVLEELDIDPALWPDFLARVLASVRGWAGHVRYRAREASLHGRDEGGERLGFLAVRLAFEGAVHAARAHPEETWSRLLSTELARDPDIDELGTSLVWQSALERGYRRRLVARLRAGPPQHVIAGAPTLQAVFCIDVRSEVLRRHLEASSERVQTVGFAGFFGFPLAYRPLGEADASSRCPALLAPPHRIDEVGPDDRAGARRDAELSRHRLSLATRLSTVSAFSFAETAGAWFGLRLLTDALGWTSPKADGGYFASRHEGGLRPDASPLDLDARAELAEGALRGMGLVRDFAQVVLLCGHGSRTANNPYGSGLDCGACGGHAGDVNARVAAEVLNDDAVRDALRARGIDIPADTRFVAGRHVTTTDEVELYDTDGLPPETLQQIRGWLAVAAERTRRERVGQIAGAEDAEPSREVTRRSRDWSEVRPEWGLARNAAFVAARRARTRCVDLGGRVFLHDYDEELDPEHAVLEAILTAPLVVANWINMQYYASAVDNDVFGSGNKVLHNVVGRHGVQLGNRSDLQVGLPLQSVHDGAALYHEPIRLQVVVEAAPEAIDAVLERHASVRLLVDNEWLTLMAWGPRDGEIRRRRPGGGWTESI